MKYKIRITATDRDRILACIEEIAIDGDKHELPHIRHLQEELEKATILENPKKTPANVITMRSRVRLLDQRTGKTAEYTLVYPPESEPQTRHISVLAPLGTAMLGYRAGDSFNVDLPAGQARFTVEDIVYQPEAAGDFHL
jgi:regulator of nucleoside diphosphate kinase